MKYTIIEKARPHKYIRRTGMPGQYEYFYEEAGSYEKPKEIKSMSADEFDKNGGFTIGVGRLERLYTLRHEYNDYSYSKNERGEVVDKRLIRRSYFVRNLGKDWSEVVNKLPSVISTVAPGVEKVFLPGYSGKLDPNAKPHFYDDNEFFFGKYAGESIDSIKEKDPQYLIWVAEEYRSRDPRKQAFLTKIKEMIQPELDERAKNAEEDKVQKETSRGVHRERLKELADVISTYSGDFSSSLASDLKEGIPLEEMSDKVVNILRDMYGKHHGRRGSKSYKEAEDKFDKFFEPEESSIEKARPHKYIKRTGVPGKYEYAYSNVIGRFPRSAYQKQYGRLIEFEGNQIWQFPGKYESPEMGRNAEIPKEIRVGKGVEPAPENLSRLQGAYSKSKSDLGYVSIQDLVDLTGIDKSTVHENLIWLVKEGKGVLTVDRWGKAVYFKFKEGEKHKVELSKEEQIDAFVEKLESGEFRVAGATVTNPAGYLKNRISALKSDIFAWESGQHDKALVAELKERLEGYEEVLRRIQPTTVKEEAGEYKPKKRIVKKTIQGTEYRLEGTQNEDGEMEYEVFKGDERVGSIMRGWTRLGGQGWIIHLPGHGGHSSNKSLDYALRDLHDDLKRDKKKNLYHGTYSEPFKQFYSPEEVPEDMQSYGQHTMGVYLTDDPKMAETFGSRVVKVAAPKKTMDLTGAKTFDDFVGLLPIDKEKAAWELKRMKADSMWGDNEIDMQYKLIEDLDSKFGIVKKLKDMGYDSMKFKEEHSSQKGNTTVVFDPHDVKIVKAVDSNIKPGVAARLITEDGYQVWGAFPERTRPMRSYSKDDEAEKEVDRIVNELTDSIWDNMKYVVIEKARPHKYIRRLGMPGQYRYFYEEPGRYENEMVAVPDVTKIVEERREEKARATYTVNAVRAWNMEAKNKYPNTPYLGDVGVRECMQNSLDAVMEALDKGQVKRGKISVEIDPTNEGYSVTDNGIGMSDTDIRDKFLSLYGTGKDIQGRFGGFGIAKAVILAPTETATWELKTRDNQFDDKKASSNEVIGTIPKMQGTQILVRAGSTIVSDTARKYVETTEVPKGISVSYNASGSPEHLTHLTNPFLKWKHETQEIFIKESSVTMSFYPRPSSDYNRRLIIRLVDKKTGAKLTQAINNIYGGFNGCVVVDIDTQATPGSNNYPLTDSRMNFKWGEVQDFVNSEISKRTKEKKSAERVGITEKFYFVKHMASWNSVINNSPTDPGYQYLKNTIDKVWGTNPQEPYTPIYNLELQQDVGYKGSTGATMTQAKLIMAFEALSKMYANKLTNMGMATSVESFHVLLSKPTTSGIRMAHYNSGTKAIGLDIKVFPQEAFSSPIILAAELANTIQHELTHSWAGEHDEEFTTKLGSVQTATAELFDKTLEISGALLGKEVHVTVNTAEGIKKIPTRSPSIKVNDPKRAEWRAKMIDMYNKLGSTSTVISQIADEYVLSRRTVQVALYGYKKRKEKKDVTESITERNIIPDEESGVAIQKGRSHPRFVVRLGERLHKAGGDRPQWPSCWVHAKAGAGHLGLEGHFGRGRLLVIEKAKPHKYIKRTGAPGRYSYTYTEGLGKRGSEYSGLVEGAEEFLKKEVPEIKSLGNGEIKFKDGSGGDFTIHTRDGQLELLGINLEKKGSGYGTKIVNALTAYADKRQVALVISKAYNMPFWEKFGFKEYQPDTLRYEPQVVRKAKINESLAKKYWVRDYHNFDPHDTPDGHWGKHQTGLNLSLAGTVFLSDNRKVKADGEWGYPNHRDIDVGRGKDRTAYSAIYSFDKEWGPTIWLYPDTEGSLNKEMRIGLSSLIGVHRITEDTPVRSNTMRNILFKLGDIAKTRPGNQNYSEEAWPIGGTGAGIYMKSLNKARAHKYIKRTGIPGHFEYFYSEEARLDAEQDIGGIKDLNFRPELSIEEKRLKYHLDKLFEAVEGVNEGIHRPEKAGMLIDKIKKLTGTSPAYALGKTITRDQATDLWKEYKKATAEAAKELLNPEISAENLKKFEHLSFLHQMMRETVAGHLGESRLAFTPDEIEEKLGLK